MPGSHFQNKSGVQVERSSRASWIEELVQEVARTLPILRPLSYYEHDHPLRPLLHLNFVDALKCIQPAFGVDSLLSPTEFADHCHSGRIDLTLLASVIDEDLRSECQDETLETDPIAALQLGTRHSLRIATILTPECECEIEADACIEGLIDQHLHPATAVSTATKEFQSWLSSDLRTKTKRDEELLQYLERDTIGRRLAKWGPEQWSDAREYAIWWYCRRGSQDWQPPLVSGSRVRASISQLLPAIDDEIRRIVVPFLSAYLDPGVAIWRLPNHDPNIFKAFTEWFAQSPRAASDSRRTQQQLAEMLTIHAKIDPLVSIESSLRALQINQFDAVAYVHDLLGIVRGWSGLIYQLSISNYPCHNSLRNFSLAQLVAMLLVLDRGALSKVMECTGDRVPVAELSKSLCRQKHREKHSQALATRQIWLFRLARSLNWSPAQLHLLRAVDWSTIHHELNSFPKFERQWVAQQAFEQSYRQKVFATLTQVDFDSYGQDEARKPAFLLITCAEPNEESIRRHAEAVCPEAETAGVPGFFNLDIKVKDCQSAHYVPHAPNNVRVRHLVSEVEMEPPFKHSTLEMEQASCSTQVASAAQSGFTIAEMAAVTSRLLVEAGIAGRLPRVVLIMGHETSSANNFYETADNCTFCSKQDVRVNTRAFVQMANDHRVREAMRLDGVTIPETTLFFAAVHDTCSDKIAYLDADTVPASHGQELQAIVDIMEQAASRNALERMQKLLTKPPLDADQAVRHSEDRQQSGAYARPEYSLMGHALCVIGRRRLTRGLTLDRRAFLFSYDPLQDDEDLTVLARLLAVNLPVLANICFDYWFSRVAPERFGAGRKAELKLIAHMGVSDAEHGDLRVGLPYEMVDQHEPMRLQVIVDARPDLVERMLAANPRASRFFTRGYMQLSIFHAGKITQWN